MSEKLVSEKDIMKLTCADCGTDIISEDSGVFQGDVVCGSCYTKRWRNR